MGAAQSRPVAVAQNAAAVTTGCTLRGFAISSTAGADVVLYDNSSTNSGLILAQFTLAAKGSLFVDMSDGARCDNGVFVSATAAVQGHIRVG